MKMVHFLQSKDNLFVNITYPLDAESYVICGLFEVGRVYDTGTFP